MAGLLPSTAADSSPNPPQHTVYICHGLQLASPAVYFPTLIKIILELPLSPFLNSFINETKPKKGTLISSVMHCPQRRAPLNLPRTAAQASTLLIAVVDICLQR